MLQNTLSVLLQSVASRYAELSPSDVGIGLRGGRLVVDDVQLRADTFNGPHIPFHVHEGRAGRLRVNVPWSALTSAPVQVYLENVHLIAGPKQSYPDHSSITRNKRPSRRPSANSAEWHQTNVGRLLFNVSVEMYGLKVEYRDHHCVGIISIASLHAYSAGPDWQRRFVSLTSGLDPDSPQATAVTMRKFVRLGGVHWVMIPRTKRAAEQPHDNQSGQLRRMDLQSYESQAPILDGIPISVKVLLHSGTAEIEHRFTPGLHAEIHVDIEDPTINLTARQIKWIDNILKAGFGLGVNSHSNSTMPSTPKRRRPQPATDAKISSASTNNGLSEDDTDRSEPEDSAIMSDDMSISSRLEKELAHQLQTSRSNSTENSSSKRLAQYPKQLRQGDDDNDDDDDDEGDGDGDDEDERDEDFDEDDLIIVQDPHNSDDAEAPQRGGLRSFWQAIVSENADDTVDDAAIALGLSNGHLPEEEDADMVPDMQEGDEAEHQFAREAVNAAAEAGGLTMQLFLRTPDHKAWEKVKKLEEELEEEKQLRTRLENAERILKESEKRIQDSEAMAQKLRDRNEALVKELYDLENLTSRAGKNKDAMIRQMEAALTKAERNLQALLQQQFEKDASKAITKSIQVNTYREESNENTTSKNSERASGNQDFLSSRTERPREQAEEEKEHPEPNNLKNSEESKAPQNQRIANNMNESPADEKLLQQGGELQGKGPTVTFDPIPSNTSTPDSSVPKEGTNGKERSTSIPTPVRDEGPALSEIQLHSDRYGQLSMDAPSISISKLIADMSTKVDVAESSRNKHLEAAMSSEGLTLI
eukprot:TRINITY_DN5088_c0_g1_i1.p1 TRINITY_DN5088_c0_g1~~TRINITY_DN5088_c0_g1_i1.p1  ORF type:complete len:825 (+),score=157.76 TRINITY_DN5088_c0_g1_i1:30-2477(+)